MPVRFVHSMARLFARMSAAITTSRNVGEGNRRVDMGTQAGGSLRAGAGVGIGVAVVDWDAQCVSL